MSGLKKGILLTQSSDYVFKVCYNFEPILIMYFFAHENMKKLLCKVGYFSKIAEIFSKV